MSIRVLHLGLGPIGCAVVTQVAGRRGFRSVGAVDIDPAKVGRDLGEVAGLGRRLRVKVSDDFVSCAKRVPADVVVLCTGSSLRAVTPQIETILRRRLPIVSTTEELSYPIGANRRRARMIDAIARRFKVGVLGTGVNPGFTMDVLPITLTGACARVDAIRVDRVQDAGLRRLPFQQKIGANLTPEQFDARVEAGTVRHVGLAESISMIAAALGWKLGRITDDIAPKIAPDPVASPFLSVERGRVCGIVQDGIGYRNDAPVIRLHMEAYLGAPETYDAVTIDGSPGLSMRIAGGVHGDVATAAIAVNSIPKILAAPPGLHTMRDLPIPSFSG